jgi:hypothetical protein
MISDGASTNSPAVMPDLEIFYSNLSHAMHAAAQALTVLQLSHSTEHIRSMGHDQLIKLASSSSQEIERLCNVLGYMQQFLAIQRCSPKLASVEISVLIADAIDGLELLFQDAGIFLVSRMPNACDPVLINAAKVSQALGTVLLVAYGMAKQKDTVELTVSCLADVVEIEVRTIGLNAGSVDVDTSLRIGMAEANIRSQNGLFSYGLEPFCAKIGLRKADQTQQASCQVFA